MLGSLGMKVHGYVFVESVEDEFSSDDTEDGLNNDRRPT